jgi:hypothetical protein
MEEAMRKLKLDMDELLVESFATADADPEARGTVHGNAATGLCTLRATRCYQETCDLSCDYTCDGSCVGGQQVC